MPINICRMCGDLFAHRRNGIKTCSDECRDLWRKLHYHCVRDLEKYRATRRRYRRRHRLRYRNPEQRAKEKRRYRARIQAAKKTARALGLDCTGLDGRAIRDMLQCLGIEFFPPPPPPTPKPKRLAPDISPAQIRLRASSAMRSEESSALRADLRQRFAMWEHEQEQARERRQSEQKHQYAINYRERRRQLDRLRVLRNPDAIRERHRIYRTNNRERVNERKRFHRNANHAAALERERSYKALCQAAVKVYRSMGYDCTYKADHAAILRALRQHGVITNEHNAD